MNELAEVIVVFAFLLVFCQVNFWAGYYCGRKNGLREGMRKELERRIARDELHHAQTDMEIVEGVLNDLQ